MRQEGDTLHMTEDECGLVQDTPGNPGPGAAENQVVCMKHTIVVREHTASWLGMGIVGGYIAITLFVAARAAFLAATETEMLQVLEQLHKNFGSAIGFVLGYYFATRANGSSNGSKGSERDTYTRSIR